MEYEKIKKYLKYLFKQTKIFKQKDSNLLNLKHYHIDKMIEKWIEKLNLDKEYPELSL